jgi:flagellar M-ring protein FliF
MPPQIAALLGRAAEMWAGLSARMRVVVVAAAAVALAIGLGLWAATSMLVDWQVLYSNLTQEDAAAVTDALRAGHVPFKVAEGGQVLVPGARVHEWRLKLASAGVPSGGNVGFEIFDKNQFGLTDFAQRLNFQRALQGELARTIGQLREVQQARVHLALPAPRVFASQDRPASASVVLRLRPGASLRADQVRGIVNLVTSSVEGLTPDRVTVVDSNGRMLASGMERPGGLSSNQVEARAGIEQEIERRVQTLLDPIVGPGRSAVRVSANLNFDQIERTEERFDPKTLVRSQTKSTENMQGASNQPTTVTGDAKGVIAAPQATASNRTQRDSEQTTYEIARTIEKTVVAPGDLRRLSIAVLLDVPLVNGVRSPRADADLDRIKRLVASAAGLRTDRRDELEVAQVPFDPGVSAPGETPVAAPNVVALPVRLERVPWTWAVGVGLAVLSIAVLLLRARRRRRALEHAVGAAFDGHNVLPDAEPVVAEPETELPSFTGEETGIKRQVLKAAKDHPDEVAQLLRAWMFRRKTVVS